MTQFTKGEWKEFIDEDGDVWVLAGEAMPNSMHAYYIGSMEDTCGECHANAQLMINAPKLYAALKRIADFAETCEWMSTGSGYRRIKHLAREAVEAIDNPHDHTAKYDFAALPEAADE